MGVSGNGKGALTGYRGEVSKGEGDWKKAAVQREQHARGRGTGTSLACPRSGMAGVTKQWGQAQGRGTVGGGGRPGQAPWARQGLRFC